EAILPERLEIGILKYLVRSCLKTSPFSTFTVVGGIPLRSDVAFQPSVSRQVRINHYLLSVIQGLLVRIPFITHYLPVRLNPTLKRESEKYSFLMNLQNLETCQVIEA